ncbi:transglutaminase family protein [Desulfobulbus rhabdoformis]|uniref:transglutaminase family protein n=1 Tax=Desulfobulbus rhabdoformis TaxID=34032 RepID=UPI001962792E|nr:transglutaminase family protein [Desulfobulbus rhabdoformis]
MGIHVALSHITTYRYDRPINLAPQVVRLRPAPHSRTPILSYSMTVTPKEHFINWQQDPFSNYLARLVFPEKTTEFEVVIDLVADMIVINPFDFFLEPEADSFPFSYDPELKEDLTPYLVKAEKSKKLTAFMATIDKAPKQTVDFLVDLNLRLSQEISYLIRMEPNVQSCEQTLSLKSGSCRDSAWLLVNILRHLGLASRFVSGYLIQLAPDVKSLDGPSGPEADFTDLHAWAEVYIPGAGWVGMDPTSGLFAGEGHIPLACSPEPQSAAPITGALDPCEVDFVHKMSVRRVREEPRSTRPYPEEVWERIAAVGDNVDEELSSQDVRLTMGGEPTFIGIDNMDADEWNTDALGEEKLRLSQNLMQSLKEQWAPGGFLHCGQGKWYPGESLPRWALTCYWRKDGVALWQDSKWLADPSRDYGFGVAEAKKFIESLANRLEVGTRYIRETFEDIHYYLYKEQRLPVNVDPKDPKLADVEERTRMARAFERGLGAVVGYVLPLQHGSWITGPWPVRGENLYLLPGDSPIGLRLPLDSLPWVRPEDLPAEFSPDPLAEREPLPDYQGQRSLAGGNEAKKNKDLKPQPKPYQEPQPTAGESSSWVVRTALCVQPRDGKLCIFMPPILKLEGYLELVAALEATAEETGYAVIIEGYTPPYDPRIESLKITPDPGVIEVNIQPMHSWREMVDCTTTLYETARQCRLATEKFLVDGRQTGTGGGNHIVVGGSTPADSPFLRRPDLLRSLLTFWNNHPALSFLFSGLFIGPTSQQPRIDEARHDSLYELEVAFKELDRQLDSTWGCPPWLVDRLFRHLLVDVSGNTHRAEFCIDKLYSPDSSTGRLGLLEFRAFEMPPHARMSLAQQLLLRTCIAWFWKTPYRQPLVHWGTRLHDRFMLPEPVQDDLADVVDILADAGFGLEMAFFYPHFEFRFPILGRIQALGMEIELRQALEPWHVLGEEPGGGGTVRFVDSSLERIQIKVSGMMDERYVVACNGRRVPLLPTRTTGVYAGGVRFRAWQPPSCLHPTIGVHAPLTIDLLDTWNGRAVAGCTYHVGHPGGRHHEVLPVNSYEAEGRRHARFSPHGHTPGGVITIPAPEPNQAFPYTLDMRR